MEFTGTPQELGDQVERLRGLNRRLEVRARNRLLTALLGLLGFAVTLFSHVVFHPGTRIPLTHPERIALAVSGVVALAGIVAFRLTPQQEAQLVTQKPAPVSLPGNLRDRKNRARSAHGPDASQRPPGQP